MSLAGTMHQPGTLPGNPRCQPTEAVVMAIMSAIHAIGVRLKSCKVCSLVACIFFGFEEELGVMLLAGTMHQPGTHIHPGNPQDQPNEVIVMAIMDTIHVIGVILKSCKVCYLLHAYFLVLKRNWVSCRSLVLCINQAHTLETLGANPMRSL